MKLDLDPEVSNFRAQARDWLAENAPKDERPKTAGPELREYDAHWQRRQYDGGWAGVAWDRAYGGRGLSLIQQVLWYEELVRARAPGHGVFAAAFANAGPTLIQWGTSEQRAFYLPMILRGESPWCQCFSEPEAGSDLASLRMRGVVDGNSLIISGSKIWSSYADSCDYGQLLVRTNPDAPKHRGLTWVAMDMHLPGVEIRPIRSFDEYPHYCEIFFDDVRVPLTNVVGQIDDGWRVALSTLAAERGPGFLDERLHQVVVVDELIDYARDKGKLDDSRMASSLAEARAMAAALRSMAYYQVSSAVPGETPGAETTAVRAFYAQVQVLVARLAVELLGSESLEWRPWTRQWLTSFSYPIAGGTIDIQKNIIGERVLGLPR